MMADGRKASICSVVMLLGTIWEYTWHSRTRRAISCAYWAPKSTTSTGPDSLVMSLPGSGPRPAGPGGHTIARPASLVGAGARLPDRVGGGGGGRSARQRAPRVRPRPVRPGLALGADRADPDPGDPAPVELGDGEPPAGHHGRLAGLRQVAQRGQQVARHRLVRSLGQLDAGLLGEVAQVEQAVDLDLAAVQLPGPGLVGVVLVLDVADQLLDQVLQGDDAGRAAVLVDHDGQGRAVAAH